MDHILVSIEYIKMMDNQMRSIIQVTVHLGFQKFYTIYIYMYKTNGKNGVLENYAHKR